MWYNLKRTCFDQPSDLTVQSAKRQLSQTARDGEGIAVTGDPGSMQQNASEGLAALGIGHPLQLVLQRSNACLSHVSRKDVPDQLVEERVTGHRHIKAPERRRRWLTDKGMRVS